MDEIHDVDKAEKMAMDIAAILNRLSAIEHKLDSLCIKFGIEDAQKKA